MNSEHITLRIDPDLSDRIERVCDELGTNRSEVVRSLLRNGLADIDGGEGTVLDGEQARAELDRIRTSEYRRTRRAWFRTNVGGRLLKCLNSGLRPEDARREMESYRREALELHDEPELAEYVADGLDVYSLAVENEAPGMLKQWVKQDAASPGSAPNVDRVEVPGAVDVGADPDGLDVDTEADKPPWLAGHDAPELPEEDADG